MYIHLFVSGQPSLAPQANRVRIEPGRGECVADELAKEIAPQLLPNKDAAIVTYCSNPACPNSQQVATKLEALGYTNVRKYREGIQDWTEAGLRATARPYRPGGCARPAPA
ncbi:rhodanese-like domain-containing protein [Nocardia iowensis]|uniref:Rhodanese-like domain-containing protein n=1 Tax=Nocardia iowensis TaxID=204891 RepID=A0ABX8RU29_NOCIO|nr:rhodanese-like domain-containing protein [Nocardia iowensis]QXN93134.1 rhodanese-like domain-containing protein [Nocardia iowensis]